MTELPGVGLHIRSMDLTIATTLSQYLSQKHRCGTVVSRPGRYTTRSGETVTIHRAGTVIKSSHAF